MSLVGTLVKVAIGVAIAKGVSTLAKGAQAAPSEGGGMFGGTTQASTPGGGLGDLLGGMLGGGGQSAQGGGLGGMMDQLSDKGAAGGQPGGGLGDLLGGMLGGGQPGQSRGLGDLLGGMMGQNGGQTGAQMGAQPGGLGGLGDLLGGLLGGAQGGTSKSLGDVLNTSFANQGEPDDEPTPQHNAAAAIMLAAMIQAAKSDGKIQKAEKDKLLGNLKDATAQEMAFVQAQLDAPVSIPNLVAHVPQGMQSQVYTMSVMAIDLDAQAEAQYLNDLAKALGLAPKQVNAIHAHLGVPALYA